MAICPHCKGGVDLSTVEREKLGKGFLKQEIMYSCPHCKKILPITDKERDMFTQEGMMAPSEVAHPSGCERCGHTGYHGREGVYEIVKFDREVSEKIRSGVSIAEIRNFIKQRGDYLISRHALEKVKDKIYLIHPQNLPMFV